MPSIREGSLEFVFPDGWHATKYDDWAHYRNQLNQLAGGMKAIDVLAVSPGTKTEPACCWLVEVKDYRRWPRTKAIDLAEEVVMKVRDTLAGLVSSRLRANDENEKKGASLALRAGDLRVVLHLEQPVKPSRLFPRAINPANVQLDLRTKLRGIDPHARVVEIATWHAVPWKAATIDET